MTSSNHESCNTFRLIYTLNNTLYVACVRVCVVPVLRKGPLQSLLVRTCHLLWLQSMATLACCERRLKGINNSHLVAQNTHTHTPICISCDSHSPPVLHIQMYFRSFMTCTVLALRFSNQNQNSPVSFLICVCCVKLCTTQNSSHNKNTKEHVRLLLQQAITNSVSNSQTTDT